MSPSSKAPPSVSNAHSQASIQGLLRLLRAPQRINTRTSCSHTTPARRLCLSRAEPSCATNRSHDPWSFPSPDRPLEVVAATDAWTCVIVPGYGFGWVRNAAIVCREERQDAQSRSIPLRSFMWWAPFGYHMANAPALGALVRLIGPNLITLHLSDTITTGAISNEVRQSILSTCPSLQHLDIELDDISSLEFLREYKESPLQSLTLQFTASPRQGSALISPYRVIPDLTRFLSNPVGRDVRGIAFEYSHEELEPLNQLVSVARRHSRLESVDALQLTERMNESLRRRLMGLDGQVFGRRGSSRATRFAILSVICQRYDGQPERPLHRLDAVLISTIFAFAASPVRRRVNHATRVRLTDEPFLSVLHITTQKKTGVTSHHQCLTVPDYCW